MSRPNPRTLLLRALETAPMERWVLAHTLHEEGPWLFCEIDRLLDRHLCHLIRGGRVQRLPDGRYELRRRTPRRSVHFEPLTIPAGTLKAGDAIQITGTISVRRQSAEADVIVVKVREAPRIDPQDFDPSTGLYFPRRSS